MAATAIANNYSRSYENAEVVTESDANELKTQTRAIYVGGTGHLTVRMVGGQLVTFSAVPAGTLLPIRAIQIMEASTATLLVALW